MNKTHTYGSFTLLGLIQHTEKLNKIVKEVKISMILDAGFIGCRLSRQPFFVSRSNLIGLKLAGLDTEPPQKSVQ